MNWEGLIKKLSQLESSRAPVLLRRSIPQPLAVRPRSSSDTPERFGPSHRPRDVDLCPNSALPDARVCQGWVLSRVLDSQPGLAGAPFVARPADAWRAIRSGRQRALPAAQRAEN